jgi:flagellar biosynthesis GTPase FlhF
LGAPDNDAAGLSASGGEFAGGPPARRASNANASTLGAQNTPRALHNRLAAQAASQPDERTSASQNGNAHVNSMRNLLSQARAAQDAVARSAHDLALRIREGASHANSSAAQRALTNQGAQALQSAGQGLLGADPNANPGDAANQGSGTAPQR